MESVIDEQLQILLDFLENHKDLANGKLRSAKNRVKSRRLWLEITRRLNSIPGGCQKTVQRWQKVWTDRKYLSKKSAALREATGGDGPPHPWELRVQSIIGLEDQATSECLPVVPESVNVEELRLSYDNEVSAFGSSSNDEEEKPASSSSRKASKPQKRQKRIEDSIDRIIKTKNIRNNILTKISKDIHGVREDLQDMGATFKIELHGIREEIRGIGATFKEWLELNDFI